jgi:hypothetical protein
MSKRKLSIVIFVCVLAVLLVWLYSGSGEGVSDEAKYDNWKHNQNAALRLKTWERRLPARLASLFHRTGLSKKYETKADEQEEAMLRSGYLVRIPILLTNNVPTNVNLVCDRLQKALPQDADGTYFWFETNRIVITCRTQDVLLCERAFRDL